MKQSLKMHEPYCRICHTFRKVILSLLEIIENYFEACYTFQDMSNIRKKIIFDLLAIQETFKNHTKYFKACKTFQDLSNIGKVNLDLLAIQEYFKNHRKIFWSMPDIPGLVKHQENNLGSSGVFQAPKYFSRIILRLLGGPR